MPVCILYCTVSTSLMESPYMSCRRSKSVWDRPCRPEKLRPGRTQQRNLSCAATALQHAFHWTLELAWQCCSRCCTCLAQPANSLCGFIAKQTNHERSTAPHLFGSSITDDGGWKLEVVPCQNGAWRLQQSAPCGRLQRLFEHHHMSNV